MRTLSDDDQAVSPVIGVILMVAITVLLAATAAAFFLELGNEQNTSGPKHAAFDFDYDSSPGATDELQIEHKSGDILEAGNLEIVISGASPSGVNGRYSLTDPALGFGAESEIRSGTMLTIDSSLTGGGSNVDLTEATVKIVLAENSGTTSKVFRTWEGPDA